MDQAVVKFGKGVAVTTALTTAISASVNAVSAAWDHSGGVHGSARPVFGRELNGSRFDVVKTAAFNGGALGFLVGPPLRIAAIALSRLSAPENATIRKLVGAEEPSRPMSDAEKKVDNVRLKMAQIASKALWRTMGRPGDVPWWFKDVRIAQDRDGNYFLKGIISDKLPMDDTGWPYGLPHTSEGVKVVAERQDPNSVEPVKLGPI